MRSVLGLLALFTCACTAPLTAEPEVVVLDREVTIEEERLVFAARGNEDLLDRVPGDILVSERSGGYLRRIVSVERAGDTIVVTTEHAALEEVLPDAELARRVTPRLGKADGEGEAQGFSFGFGEIDLPGENGLRVNITGGHFRFDPDIDFAVRVKRSVLEEVRAIATGEIDAEIHADVEVAAGIDKYVFKPLWKQPYTFVQIVGGIPVVEVLELSLGVGLEIKTHGSARVLVGGRMRGHVSAGSIWENGAWREVATQELVFTPETRVLSGEVGEIEISALIYAEVAFKLYGVAGPALRVVPFASLAHLPGSDTFVPSVGVKGFFEGVLSLPFVSDKERVPWRKKLFEERTPFSPIRVGAQTPSPSCNGIDEEGLCDSGVAIRCEAGALVIDDCARAGLGCDQDGAGVARCAAGCGELDFHGGCVDESLRWCQDGRVQTYACPLDGPGCGWKDDTIGFDCL